MQIKTTVKYYLTPIEWLSPNKQDITWFGENVEKGEPLCTVCVSEIGAATMENSMEIPQKN